MPLVIRPLDGLGLEGVPWLDVGLVGVTSAIVMPLEPNFKPFMIQGIGRGWSRWGGVFII